MREDIVGMLKNAIEKGGHPEKIAESLINSGYNAIEVRQALAYVTGGTLSSLNAPTIPQTSISPVSLPPIPSILPNNSSIYQQVPQAITDSSQTHYLQIPTNSVGNNVGSNNPMNIKVILLVSVLVLLISGLIMTMIFKDDILKLFG